MESCVGYDTMLKSGHMIIKIWTRVYWIEWCVGLLGCIIMSKSGT